MSVRDFQIGDEVRFSNGEVCLLVGESYIPNHILARTSKYLEIHLHLNCPCTGVTPNGPN